MHTLGALALDVGHGDITTQALFPKKISAHASVIANDLGIFAGGEEILWFLKKMNLRGLLLKKDGGSFQRGYTLIHICGDGRRILHVERTLLNFLQRMCSIATYTHHLRKKMPRGLRLAATRKTLWGVLDKKAVMVGGGDPHRLGLFDAVLVKDNHLQLVGNKLCAAINRIHGPCQIEVETLRDAITAATLLHNRKNCGLLLDNFSLKNLRIAVRILRKRFQKKFLLEASGGITEKNLALYAKSGVDRISMSALTLAPPMLDFSLEVVRS